MSVQIVPPISPATTTKRSWDRVMRRAVTDRAYRARLLSEPATVLSEEGIGLPQGMRVTAVEFDPQHAYLILPPFGAALTEHDIPSAPASGGPRG